MNSPEENEAALARGFVYLTLVYILSIGLLMLYV